MKRNWNRNVQELEGRLKKANDLFDKEFPEFKGSRKEKEETAEKMSGNTNSSVTEKVIRDKNTIVQITVHTKPKDKENKSLPRYLEPTIESRSRSRSSGHKKSPRRQSRKPAKKEKEKENIDKTAEVSSKRDVPELLQELKDVIQSSGIKDVYEFIREMEDGNVRRKSAPGPISQEKAGIAQNLAGKSKPALQQKPLRTVKQGNAPHRVTARLQSVQPRLDEDIHNQEIRERIKSDNEKLALEINKLKSEVNRYKNEFDNSQVQLKIARESNDTLQNQIVEMKQLIAKLTGNNKNLLQLVSDRTAQDEKFAELELKNKHAYQQLDKEKATVTALQNKVREQENEIRQLKLLTADINAQLMHGLEGLEIPRPASSLPSNLLNLTSDILGNTILKPEQKKPQGNPPRIGSSGGGRRPESQSSDSAIDDPNSEKLNLLPARPVFHAPPPPRVPPPRGGGGGSTTPSTMPYSSNQSSASKIGGQFRFPQSSVYSNSPPTRQVSSRLRQQTSQLVDEMELPGTAVSSTMISRQTSRNLFSQPSRVGNTSLMNSILAEDSSPSKENSSGQANPVPKEDNRPKNIEAGQVTAGGGQEKFSAASLNLEETVDQDDMDGISGHTKSTPATVIQQRSSTAVSRSTTDTEANGSMRPTAEIKAATASTTAAKQQPAVGDLSADKLRPNLESKVQDFLDRLRQDSLNYSMPQAQSFQGASFHLSLSGDEALPDLSRDTTLTEGGFCKGLESSIDILSQE